MLPINKKISAYNYFSSNDIKYIVLHDVGAKSTAKNNVDYFFGGDRGASAHYFVDDTSIWQSVEDKHGAWHCGDGYGKYGITNQNSIGIELCLPSGTVTAKTEQNTLEIVKYLMAKYNVPADRVVRHYDASRKNCPAQFNKDGKWTRWNAFKAKLVAKPSTPSKPKLLSATAIRDEVILGKWGTGQDRINRLTKAGYNAKKVQDDVNKKLLGNTSKPKKSNQEVAREIYLGQGGWGNGATRIANLKKAGYNPNAVQALVNKMY
ncbi:N-acetylmuramoyl-L-alanine amidase [Enterococcus sp.]|uniref:N-acetylmuramoyl-L-alanine amidase n=1 Tax=Enterococcus sp. TaxID=35783 RepID=UPI002FCB8FDE